MLPSLWRVGMERGVVCEDALVRDRGVGLGMLPAWSTLGSPAHMETCGH